MPMTPEKKAALEKYLKGGAAGGPPMKDKPPMGGDEMPAAPMQTGEEGMEDEDSYGDYEGPESYRAGQEDDGELEVYAADRDPEDMETTDKPPREEDPKARGKRIGGRTSGALSSAFEGARQSIGGRG